MSVMKLSVCSSTFVNPFAPCALPHFITTTGSSDFHEKNASDLILLKFDFDFNILLTFRGSPKFLAQLISYMPRSRTPVNRYFLFQKFACCLRSYNTVSAFTLCSKYLTVLYHFTFVAAYNFSVYASLWSLPSSLQDSIRRLF